jgi:hypothetical protein
LAHHFKKQLKLWRLPKIKGSILKYRVPPLWPTYIGGMEDNNFAKAYEIKVMCYGEHVGEHIENLRNPLGT